MRVLFDFFINIARWACRRIDEAWNVLGLTNVPGMELSTAALQ